MKKKKLMIPIWYFALFSSTKWLTNQSSSLPSSHNNVIGHMKLSLFISICLWWHLCPPLWFPLLIFFHMQFLCNWIEKDNSAICTPPPQKKRIPNERLLCVSRVMQSGKEAKRTLPCILIWKPQCLKSCLVLI